jgi:hypothetical protein
MSTLLARFEKYYMPEPNSGCWIWFGAERAGYGVLTERRGKVWLAHRLSYIFFKGEIPIGKVLDHLCRNTYCVNPAHLEAVTLRENVLRSPDTLPSINLRKTHCKHGHLLQGDNLEAKAKWRCCKICHIQRQQAYMDRKRGR